MLKIRCKVLVTELGKKLKIICYNQFPYNINNQINELCIWITITTYVYNNYL